MPLNPERGPLPIQERSEEASPLTIERKEVASPVSKTFKAQVSDDKGTPLIQTPPASVFTVTLPTSQQNLAAWSKGNTTSSLTWLGAFWLRIIKKAIHFGWKIVRGGEK